MFASSDHKESAAEFPPGPVQGEETRRCKDPAGRPQRQRGEDEI